MVRRRLPKAAPLATPFPFCGLTAVPVLPPSPRPEACCSCRHEERRGRDCRPLHSTEVVRGVAVGRRLDGGMMAASGLLATGTPCGQITAFARSKSSGGEGHCRWRGGGVEGRRRCWRRASAARAALMCCCCPWLVLVHAARGPLASSRRRTTAACRSTSATWMRAESTPTPSPPLPSAAPCGRRCTLLGVLVLVCC